MMLFAESHSQRKRDIRGSRLQKPYAKVDGWGGDWAAPGLNVLGPDRASSGKTKHIFQAPVALHTFYWYHNGNHRLNLLTRETGTFGNTTFLFTFCK